MNFMHGAQSQLDDPFCECVKNDLASLCAAAIVEQHCVYMLTKCIPCNS